MSTEKNLSFTCGNCNYNCCCFCENINCSMCKKFTCQFKNMSDNRCAEITKFYKDHYACFTCKEIHKSINRWGYDRNMKKKKNYLEEKGKVCSKCNNKMLRVSPDLRFPKKNNMKEWNLIYKILSTDFYNAPDNSLIKKIFNCRTHANIFYTRHCDDSIRGLIYYPKKFREYDEWVKYMRLSRP